MKIRTKKAGHMAGFFLYALANKLHKTTPAIIITMPKTSGMETASCHKIADIAVVKMMPTPPHVAYATPRFSDFIESEKQ